MTWQTTNTAKGENKLYSDAKGVVPSLDLRFASQKNLNDYMTGTPLVDHQRSMSGSNLSPGTFVNSSGLIETAKVNLIAYSETNTGWTQSQGVTYVTGYGSSPDGATNSIQVTFPTSINLCKPGGNVAITSGISYVFSIYLKSDSLSWAAIRTLNSDADDYYYFDLSNGVIGSSSTLPRHSIESAGNGWYRCSVYATINITASQFSIYGASADETISAGSLQVWGAQLETGTTASTYIPTSGVPSAAPRFDHNPTTGESLGLLIEESRTNSYPLSVDFGYGSAVNTVITNNQATAPDNTNTASIFKENAANAAHTFFAVNFAPSGTHTTSIWVKEIQSTPKRYFGLRVYGVGTGITWVNFDLETGTVVGSAGTQLISTFIDPYPNGWYRCGYSSNSDVSGAADGVQLYLSTQPTLESPSYLGDNTSGFYIWGFQVEAGSFPTSYIPTTGTALTRSADLASITGSNFSSWYNQSEGTVFGNYSSFSYGNATTLPTTAHFTDGTLNNYIRLNSGSAYVFRNFTNAGNVNQSNVTTGGVPASGVSYSFAVGIALNDMAVYANGLSNFDTTYLVPVVNKIEIGNWFAQSNTWLNGTISRLTYFPERLPDATLQAITAS